MSSRAKVANRLFSRAITTHNIYPECYHTTSCSNLTQNQSNSLDNLDVLNEINQDGSLQNPFFLSKIISKSAKMTSFYLGIQLHAHVTKLGSNIYINSALVDMYGKCGKSLLAHKLFDEIPERNEVTWNALISGYLDTHYPKTAIELFIEMLRLKICLTAFSISSVLVGSSQLQMCELGEQVHGLSLKAGFGGNVVAGTGLIEMYAKCSNVEASRRVFDHLPDKNVMSWSSMISGYAQAQCATEAMVLVKEMLCSDIRPNHVTYNSLVSSFCRPEDFDQCKQIHCRIIKEGCESNNYLGVTLVIAYSECGCRIEDFYEICSSVSEWDQVAWNAVLAGFSNLGVGEEALKCFRRMRQAGIAIDFFTLASILKAIGNSSALKEGKETHALVFKTGYAKNVSLQNALVSMYARCGKLNDAMKVFSSMGKHDLISWNALLSGCAHHGYGKEVVEIFEKMRISGVKPNLTTFLIVLSACSHVGLLDEGVRYFDLMVNDDSLPLPKLEHYACIVDLYGRAGFLHKAEAFINTMPIEPGPYVFKALLSACQVHGNKEIAVRCARKLVELCPNDPATYILLANVLSIEGDWSDAAGVRKLMCDIGVSKKPGHSWI